MKCAVEDVINGDALVSEYSAFCFFVGGAAKRHIASDKVKMQPKRGAVPEQIEIPVRSTYQLRPLWH